MELFHSGCNRWEDVKAGQCYCSYRCYFWVISHTSFLIWPLSPARQFSIRLQPHLSIDTGNPLIKPIQVAKLGSLQGLRYEPETPTKKRGRGGATRPKGEGLRYERSPFGLRVRYRSPPLDRMGEGPVPS